MKDLRDPRKTFGEALVEVGAKNDRVVALSADSSSGSGMKPFHERFPERHFEFGIMEQGIAGISAGMASTGKIPFFVAIAPFVTSRPFEMVRNDLGYMRQNVKVVGRCAGMTYADLGPTHQSLEDIAMMRTIPGFTVVNPGCPVEIIKATHAIVDHKGPVYMKLGGPKMPVLFDEDHDFQLGKGVTMQDGRDVTLVGTGTVLSKAHAAAEILEKQGISVRLINIHTIKPLDRDLLLKAARETKAIVTVEEHYIAGGLGSAIAETLAESCPVRMKMIGVNDRFASNGPYEELLAQHGLQAEQIAETVKAFLA